MSEPAQTAPPEKSPIPPRDSSAIRILLIEDNPGDARLIQELLLDAKGSRFECVCVQRLVEALARLGKDNFDIILLDLSLPDSQGFATFTRASATAPDMPIVLLTGLDDEDLALKAVREGAQDYLVKGRVESDLLERVIRYSIERQRVQRELHDLNVNLEHRVSERTQELSAAYEALIRANKNLRELDRMKSAFITVTSHELRTPLTVVCGMLSVLHERLSGGQSDLVRCCQPALHAAQRLERLVARTLELADRGEYGRHLECEPVDVSLLVEDAIEEVAPFVERRQQKLSSSVPDDLPVVLMDRDKIQDVLVNLLMNAVKFTHDGGAIRVIVERRGGDQLQFKVIDTGIGIRDEDKLHVFEEFFTSLETLEHSSGEFEFEKRGIGLGLAIVKKFVEMHDGTVGLESTVGEGAAFHFTLPMKRP